MILVTGGAGFIGSNLCEKLLEDGEKIVVIDNFHEFYPRSIKERNIKGLLNDENFKLVEGDIRDEEVLEKIFSENKIEVVVNLAGMAGVRPSLEDPRLYVEVNIDGYINLLEMSKKYGVKKFVQGSSSSVYGNNKKVPFSEEDNVDKAISPYASTKKSGEVMGYTYSHLYNIDMIQLRFFTVYGPRQRPDLAIHKFVNLIETGEAIPFYGDGSSERDYTYVGDIVEGIGKSIRYLRENKDVYEIINLGSGRTISLKAMVETIENVMEKEVRYNILPSQPGDVRRTYGDIKKAKRLLGYDVTMDFVDGIKEFYTWYREN